MAGRRKMITIEVELEKMKELYLQKIDEHLQELESEVFFMNSTSYIFKHVVEYDCNPSFI
ncbi:hypothetical protein SporoP32a_05625 [Sporosarcina ureae]|nr:hypothetical protein SporoP32a_05625 [Sporosarcina ureae]